MEITAPNAETLPSMQQAHIPANSLRFDYDKPIAEQLEEIDQMATLAVAKWMEIAAGLLEMGGNLLPSNPQTLAEKATEMARLLKKYRSLNFRQYVEAIRAAAREKMVQLTQHPERFPRLFAYEIEVELQQATAKMLQDREAAAFPR